MMFQNLNYFWQIQDYVKIQNDIEKFLKDSVLENKADGGIFGVSGGIDSAIIAYLSS